MARLLLLILVLLFSNNSFSGYNANMTGEIVQLRTYTTGLILFKLNNQPSSHPACNASYFAISTDIAEATTNRMYSRLLAAHATKAPINIGYDNTGDCSSNYIRVHEAG